MGSLDFFDKPGCDMEEFLLAFGDGEPHSWHVHMMEQVGIYLFLDLLLA